MKLVWKYGEEAICPSCGHQNACLYHGPETYQCRDCKKVFQVTEKPMRTGTDLLLGRGIFEAECKEVTK